MVHIYTGDGKGKTTAATGLAVRAAGYGKKVNIIQFLKASPSGEVKAIEGGLPSVVYHRLCDVDAFYPFMDESQRRRTREQVTESFALAKRLLPETDFLILDEIFAAVSLGLVAKEDVIRLIESTPADVELVLTGRDAAWEIAELCDYVSEVRCVKHPFDKGADARAGVEF